MGKKSIIVLIYEYRRHKLLDLTYAAYELFAITGPHQIFTTITGIHM
jgi:hypothetical protein